MVSTVDIKFKGWKKEGAEKETGLGGCGYRVEYREGQETQEKRGPFCGRGD